MHALGLTVARGAILKRRQEVRRASAEPAKKLIAVVLACEFNISISIAICIIGLSPLTSVC